MRRAYSLFSCGLLGCLTLSISLVSFNMNGWAAAHGDRDAVLEQRRVLLQAAADADQAGLQALQNALSADAELLRLTAVHLLAAMGETGRPGLAAALRCEHPDVRRVAVTALGRQGVLSDYWGVVLLDEDPAIQREVRLIWMHAYTLPSGAALEKLVADLAQPYDEGASARRISIIALLDSFDEFNNTMRALLTRAIGDEDPHVRTAAFQALMQHLTPACPDARTLLDAALQDADERVRDVGQELRWHLLQVAPFRLPVDGWRFQLDPGQRGRDEQWFAVEYDDSAWEDDGQIETHWHNFLDEAYIGAAWYRRNIDLPAFENWDKAYLDFGGVDEGAWVWVNGQFVGEHDIGPRGWDQPFLFEVTEHIRPGQTNQIAILARNTTGGGGIWRPVRLRVINTQALAGHAE